MLASHSIFDCPMCGGVDARAATDAYSTPSSMGKTLQVKLVCLEEGCNAQAWATISLTQVKLVEELKQGLNTKYVTAERRCVRCNTDENVLWVATKENPNGIHICKDCYRKQYQK